MVVVVVSKDEKALDDLVALTPHPYLSLSYPCGSISNGNNSSSDVYYGLFKTHLFTRWLLCQVMRRRLLMVSLLH